MPDLHLHFPILGLHRVSACEQLQKTKKESKNLKKREFHGIFSK